MPFEIITLNTNWKKRVLIVSKKFFWKHPMKPNNHIVIDLVVTWKVTKCCMKKIYPSLWPHVGSCWNFIFLPQKCRILKILNWGGQLNWTDQLIVAILGVGEHTWRSSHQRSSQQRTIFDKKPSFIIFDG